MKRVIMLLCVMVVMGWFSGAASELRAQDEYGMIRGKISLDDGSRVPGVTLTLTGDAITKQTTVTNEKGYYRFHSLPVGNYQLKAELEGFKTITRKGISLKAGENLTLDLIMETCSIKEEIVVCGKVGSIDCRKTSVGLNINGMNTSNYYSGEFNTEEYDRVYENRFKDTASSPLSTFSIDVDTASYANSRRFIKGNNLPPKDAVRIEEFINYFTYNYPQPENGAPFSIVNEVSRCPWNNDHLLVHLGLQGKKIKSENRVASNLVFLLDVSGSMDEPLKLPLVQSAYKLLVGELSEKDRVAIVVYAGAAGLVLPSTPGDQKEKITGAIEQLRAGGCTAGGEGIILAYQMAMDNFISGGNNRVILATDGDFNIGVSSTSELVRLIEEKREKGVFLTVLGFGMGNYKDSRMEQLADKGNGNFFYIDSLLEAKKVFINELGSTLFTIAKDVKIQVEFNPAKVKAYKLIGYENRLLENEDFNDDKKDAGELGAGHSVTALYEIIPANSDENLPGIDILKYQRSKIRSRAYKCKELMTVKLRYKEPDGNKSKLLSLTVEDRVGDLARTSDNFRFSAAVAELGLLLRESPFKANASYEHVLAEAKGAKGQDPFGYRAEFIQLVELCQLMSKSR